MVNFIEPRHGYEGNYLQRHLSRAEETSERDLIAARVASRNRWQKRARWLRLKARVLGRPAVHNRPAARTTRLDQRR